MNKRFERSKTKKILNISNNIINNNKKKLLKSVKTRIINDVF